MGSLRPWMLAPLAWLAGGVLAAPAMGAVIGFDDQVTGGPGGAGALVTVNSQYAGQGVTFNNVRAIDYAKGASAIPGFAHSPTVAVEQCFAQEFCTTPVRADFTAGQTLVRVWVGASFPVSQAIPVRLTAFDAGGAVVGMADGTIPVTPGAAPVATPLQVTSGPGSIRRLEVSSPGGFMNGVAVDDVEFSTVGPPPPCTATALPAVTLTLPTDGTVVQRNEFILRGTVQTNGAPVESARIMAIGSAARSGNLFPVVVRPEGGTFGPIRMNGLLAPGDQKVSVEVTTCRGTAVSGNPIVTHTPLPAGTRFRLLRLEVTQGVQTSDGGVPVLAAGANGAKRSFVRATLAVEGGPARVTGVSATLTASRPDGSPAPGPLSVRSLRAVTVDTAGLAEGRRSLDRSLAFEIPRQWLTVGPVHLQVTRLAIEGEETVFGCTGCDNRTGTQPRLVRPRTTPPVRVQIVSVPYTIPGSPTVHQPRQRDIDHLASWLRRAYPADRVEVTQAALAVRARPPASCDEVNADLRTFAAGLTPRPHPETRFYGLVDDNGGANFMRGCADIGGTVGSGPTGSGTFGWDNDGSYGDWYGGHEIGHTYDRRHPGYCDGQPRDDRGFPYAGGGIGTQVFDSQGFDPGDAALSIPMAVLDFRDGWSDVMTYCDREWVSDYTYRGILTDLCDNDRPNCPDHGVLVGRRAATELQAPRRRARIGLSVTGVLRPATGRLALRPMSVTRGALLTVRPARGRYAVRLLGTGGRVLATYPFTPIEQSDPPSPRRATAAVDVVVPFVGGTRRIQVTDRRRVLATVRVTANAPRVRVTAPRAGRLRDRVTVRWTARDPDGGRLSATVLYSPDGRRFIPVAADVRGRRLVVDMRTLPGGSRARFRVVVSDGVLAGRATTRGRLRAPVRPPRVSIATPAAGDDLSPGVPVNLVGSATDLQDGTLPAGRVVWSSSLQGRLGTGPGIAVPLVSGTHVITLTGRNRAGLVARAEVTVTVRPAPPPVVIAVP